MNKKFKTISLISISLISISFVIVGTLSEFPPHDYIMDGILTSIASLPTILYVGLSKDSGNGSGLGGFGYLLLKIFRRRK